MCFDIPYDREICLDDTNSAVSAPVSSRAADISDDSDEDYRSKSEYNNWLTREDKTVKEGEQQLYSNSNIAIPKCPKSVDFCLAKAMIRVSTIL